MLHAKTAVCDGRWARVGSTNLNIVSWLGNYELDVALEDARFAGQMEEMYLADLENSTELVLSGRRMRSAVPRPRAQRMPRRMRGSAGRAAAGALRVSNTVTAAISERRTLESGERRMVFLGGLALLAVAALWAIFPRILGVPLAVLLGWLGLSLLKKAWGLRRPQQPTSPASLPTVHDGTAAVPPAKSVPLRGDASG
jgi:cardiolipin synthase A/B